MSAMKEENPSLENNTDAAARTENVELLTRLPEELIHRILGFLTSKDAVRASFASKSMEAAWLSSCTALHFINLQQFTFFASDQQFLKYVSTTMERVSNHKINLQSFKFETFKFFDTETLDKWIGVALDGRVCEIGLSLDQGVPYCLPARVLSSSFLKCLDLVSRRYDQLSLLGDDVTIINLPCLQSLTLIRVSIDEDALQSLLNGCPLLEHLKITCSLSQLNVSHLKLKSLDVTDMALDKVEVDAPCLEQFSYSNTSYQLREVDIILKSSTSKNLKCIFLYLFTRSSMELWLSKILPKCTSLETLDLRLKFEDVKTVKISNPHIKNIAVTSMNVAEIEMEYCPMLLSLRCIANNLIIPPSLLSVMINHQPNYVGHLHIRHCCYTDLNMAWFHKLRELLSKSCITAMSLSCLLPSREDIENGDNESFPTSAVTIRELYLMVRGPESCYSFIMNGFLSACHPDTTHLAQPPSNERKPLMHFKKFFLEKLENWKDEDGCYCSSNIKCWKHQLKKVEIQEVSKLEGKERVRYDFGIQQPEPPSFRIEFQWC